MNKTELSFIQFNDNIKYNCDKYGSQLVLQIFYCLTALYTVEDLEAADKKIMDNLYSHISGKFLHKRVINNIKYNSRCNIAHSNIETLDYICKNVILYINTFSKQRKMLKVENIKMFPENILKDSLIRMGLTHGDKLVKKELANYKLKGN